MRDSQQLVCSFLLEPTKGTAGSRQQPQGRAGADKHYCYTRGSIATNVHVHDTHMFITAKSPSFAAKGFIQALTLR
jgi:hypothetical protein